jgi:phenylacetic acid degradation operon negative regulatory protein
LKARSLLFDLWGDYIQHVANEVSSSTLATLMAPFGVSESAMRQAVSRTVRQGWLQSRRAAGRSSYFLTPDGQSRIEEASKRVYHPEERPWDGVWRVLAYSVPEGLRERRDELRRELVWTGFGALAPGLWISPNPLEEAALNLIRRYELASYVHMFRSTYLGPHSAQELVATCWNLDGIAAHYQRFIEEWLPRLQEQADRVTLDDVGCYVERLSLVHAYRKFLFVDPGLPAELLPSEWLGDDARRLFQMYYALLAPGAHGYLDQVFRSNESKGVETDVQTGRPVS